MATKNKNTSTGLELTKNQERFCREYIIDLNGKQAAIRAGFSKRSAEVQASKMLRISKVRDYVDHLKQKRAEKLEITSERVLRELAKIGFSDIRDYFDGKGVVLGPKELTEEAASALSSIEIDEIYNYDPKSGKKTKQGETKKIKLHNKIAALDALAKHLGLFSKDNEQRKSEATVFYLPDDGRNKKA